MPEKRKPIRTCIGCGKKKEKEDLIRIVLCPDGSVRLDEKGHENGRGAYLCRDNACLERAIRSRALNRTFRRPIPVEEYRSLEEEFEQYGK